MRVDTSGGSLYVRTEGSGNSLMLVHGWPLDHRMFERQLGPLSEHFNVIAFDRRGFGRSSAPPDLLLEPDDIDRILDRLQVDGAHLLGMSQGGRIALRYAATRPGRVRSLLLQGAAVDGLDSAECDAEKVPIAEFAKLARAGRIDDVRARWLAHPMMQTGPEHESAGRLIREIVQQYSGLDLAITDPAGRAFGTDVLQSVSTSAIPVLLLTGADETAARRGLADTLLQEIPRARQILFPASGHLCNLTEPERYNRAVIDFCTAVDRDRR